MAVVLAHRVTDTIKEHRGARDASSRSTATTSGPWRHPRSLRATSSPGPMRGPSPCSHRLTDDAAAVSLLRHPVALLENPFPNPKLTTPSDLAYLEFLLTPRAESRAPFLPT